MLETFTDTKFAANEKVGHSMKAGALQQWLEVFVQAHRQPCGD